MPAHRLLFRKLVRAPLFTLTAVITLALGIGANVAIFSVIQGVLLKPLPYADSERLVATWYTAPGLGFEQVNQSAATYFTLRDHGDRFVDVGLWQGGQGAVTGLAEPEQVQTMMVTDGVLPLLGADAHLGRRFTADDDSSGAPPTVMLSYAYWQERFGGDPETVGSTLVLSGRNHEIIGVLPRGFRILGRDADIYYPAQFDRSRVFMGQFNYQGIARLAPGVTPQQAEAEAERLIPVAVETFSGGLTMEMLQEARFGADIHPLKEDVVGDIGTALWLLLGSVGLVLLIACANVANLFLVRAEARHREMALRSALGAGRGKLALHFLSESTMLSLLGGAVGVGLAAAGTRLLVAIGPSGLPRLEEISIDRTVLLFALVTSLLSGLLFGLFPLLRVGDGALVPALNDGGRTAGAGRQRHRLRHALVVSQVALALVLLVGSGLMWRSFQALRQADPGFARPEQVLTFRLSVPHAEVEEADQVVQIHQQILERLSALPGVASAGATLSIPMGGNDSNDALTVEGFPADPGQLPPIRRYKFIAGDYFETLGNPILAGRSIEWADVLERRPVAVITENLAREYWGDPQSALGKRISDTDLDNSEPHWREIVGVVGDVRDNGLEHDAVAIVYWPIAMVDFWGSESWVQRSLSFVLRSPQRPPHDLLSEARDAVWAVNANLPLANVRTLDEVVAASLARTSFTLLMLALAAAVALLLGTVGIYAVISYVVSQRTREIGVRMALGARRRDVRGMMLRYGGALAVGGVGLGVLVALAFTRWMSSLLFGVAAADPLTFAAVSLLVAAIALLASYFAARRAAAIDPIAALRAE